MDTPQHALRERVSHELREYAVTAAYLFVWLSALLLYENAVRDEGTGPAVLPFGVAAAKALVLGKFVLLGQAVGAGTRLSARTLAQRIAWRSLALLLVVVALVAVEEIVLGLVHGETLTGALAAFAARPLEHAAGALLLLLVLIPFVATKQIHLALGEGRLARLLAPPVEPPRPPS